MKKIITTVGTSLFSNNLSGSESRSLELLKGRSASNDWGERTDKINSLKEATWKAIKGSTKSTTSAEIQTIFKIKNKSEEPIVVYLIASDTILSKLAAILIQDWLRKEQDEMIHVSEEVFVVQDLSVHDSQKFLSNGIHELINTVLNIKDDTADQKENTDYVLNISGGYKGVIPILTIVGQIYDIPLIYMYEDSDEPIEIQRLPISFDWDVIEEYVTYLVSPDKITEKEAPEMKRLHLIQKTDHTSWQLTVVGKIISDYLQRQTPFFATPFGYFIEYKLKEFYDKVYGCSDVIHSYKPKSDGDIDLLIQQESGFIGVEIKPFTLLANADKLADFMKKLLLRCKSAETALNMPPKEFWLFTYSFKKENDPPVPQLDINTTNLLSEVSKIFTLEYNDSIFHVKHLYVKPNKIKGGERILYQKFLRSSIKEKDVKTIFTS